MATNFVLTAEDASEDAEDAEKMKLHNSLRSQRKTGP